MPRYGMVFEEIQRGHPLVWEEPLLFCTLVGFQVLTVTKTRSQVVGDVKKLQLLCLDTHEIVWYLKKFNRD
jgi:hypothetical protein